MTSHHDLDRTLVEWFEADAQSPVPAGGLELALDATRRRTPWPARLAGVGSHWVGDAPTANSNVRMKLLPRSGLRWSTAVVLLLVIGALVGATILVGARLLRPSLLPFGHLGHLAYSLDGDVYVADWDGRNPVRVSDRQPGGRSACPPGYSGSTWSPNGRYLAYRCRSVSVSSGVTIADGTVNISHQNGNPVASFPGVGDALSWSPDSTRVATWLDWDSQTIGVYGLDGTRQALLTLPPGYATGRDEDPVWSPDGASLLVSLRAGTHPRQTWELPVDGRVPRPVSAADPRSRLDVAYSPDGARIAYVNDGSIVVAERDGSRPRTLITGAIVSGEPPFWSLKWSPMGDRIAFAAATGGQTDFGSVSDLWLVDLSTGAVTRLGVGAGTDALFINSYSPEADRILFSRIDASDARSLWTVRVDGSDARPVVTGTDFGDWEWQPADR